MLLATMATGLIPGNVSVASLLLRWLLGAFFLLVRFRYVYDPSKQAERWFNSQRHVSLERKICMCGFGRSEVLTAVVAAAELVWGSMVLVGFETLQATTGLLVILAFATYCTARQKVSEQKPVDTLDCIACYLWRVEGVYIVIALAILALGPGAYSMDRWLH